MSRRAPYGAATACDQYLAGMRDAMNFVISDRLEHVEAASDHGGDDLAYELFRTNAECEL